jgi:hypothetical protein
VGYRSQALPLPIENLFFTILAEQVKWDYLSLINWDTSTLCTWLISRNFITFFSSLAVLRLFWLDSGVWGVWGVLGVGVLLLPVEGLGVYYAAGRTRSYCPLKSRVIGLSCIIFRELRPPPDETPVVSMLFVYALIVRRLSKRTWRSLWILRAGFNFLIISSSRLY